MKTSRKTSYALSLFAIFAVSVLVSACSGAGASESVKELTFAGNEEKPVTLENSGDPKWSIIEARTNDGTHFSYNDPNKCLEPSRIYNQGDKCQFWVKQMNFMGGLEKEGELELTFTTVKIALKT